MTAAIAANTGCSSATSSVARYHAATAAAAVWRIGQERTRSRSSAPRLRACPGWPVVTPFTVATARMLISLEPARLDGCTRGMRRPLVVLLLAGLVAAPTAAAKGPHAVLSPGTEPIERGRRPIWSRVPAAPGVPTRRSLEDHGGRRIAGR